MLGLSRYLRAGSAIAVEGYVHSLIERLGGSESSSFTANFVE
jgi:hypothetical protein